MRVAFLAAEAIPFLRRYSIAFSMSPAVSVSDFLQSAMPAPVRSRRSLIICAVISAMSVVSSWFPVVSGRLVLARFVVGGSGGFGRRQVAATARYDLDARPFAARRDADGLLFLSALFL